MTRSTISLDGSWNFWKETGSALSLSSLPETSARIIQVPGPWQAQFEDLRWDYGTAWYRRIIELPAGWFGKRAVILGFGAVDYRAEAWVNDTLVGRHEGGYLPFELDITSAAHPGVNTITVRVEDRLNEFGELPHGKQAWYGPISGLWQSVWVESRPQKHLLGMKISPAQHKVDVEVRLNQDLASSEYLDYKVYAPDGDICAQGSSSTEIFTIALNDPQLWEPDDPKLYTLKVTLAGNTDPDEQSDHFGFRTFEAHEGRLLLNGHPFMLRAALDQDYYPDRVYTPPSLEFIEDQLRKAKHMGLNTMRVHIKVADPRYYEAADRIGILIWTEIPNWSTLTETAKRIGRQTLDGILERDWNHPSIGIWTIINENWGTNLAHDASHRAWLAETYDYLKSIDPFRLVVDNSACHGNFHVVTDIEDFHNYYAIPDHYPQWRDWTAAFASRAPWTFAFQFKDEYAWNDYLINPWSMHRRKPAPEVRRTGKEPLILSEFGNWGLPDLAKLRAGYGGKDPWWFETGYEFGDGVVYPHGVDTRFHDYRLDRAFGDPSGLAHASQQSEYHALKYEIEQIRKHDSLCGYVITEFTDVHWECNGMLDMCRNPKAFYDTIGQINADDVLIPEWKRLSYWPGETVEMPLLASHYSRANWGKARLAWHLEGFADVHGEVREIEIPAYEVTPLGTIRFAAPEVKSAVTARLVFELFSQDGTAVVQTDQEMTILARPNLPTDVLIYSPDLADALKQAGYKLTKHLSEAALVVARDFDIEMYAYAQSGGKVLWLADGEPKPGLPMGLSVAPRKGTALQGDWASAYSWIVKDPVFQSLPPGAGVGFAYIDLTPENVLHNINACEYADRVYAGIFAGWIQKSAALVAEQPLGNGKVLVSTFRLSEHILDHPTAAAMLRDMVVYLAKA
jgi:hypothetical protein